jgi:hypothetical protein
MKEITNCKKGIIAVSIIYFIISFNTVFSQDTSAVKQDTVALKLNMFVQLITGQLDSLKNAKIVNIEFRNDTTKVGKMTEIDYINKKVKDLNEKESGKGDKWLVSWKEKRSLGEQWMIEYLNKSLTKAKLTFQKDFTTAKYTLVVNSFWIEEGWDVFVQSSPSIAGLSLTIIETQDRNKEVATLTCVGAGAAGVLASAYASAGKNLGKAIYKYLYAKKK